MITVGQPLILALDTATTCCSVALTSGTQRQGKVLASLSFCGTVSHSRRLLASVDWLLAEAAVSWSALDGIAVSVGPGSFTGLRIGMATAKGFACSAEKPLLGVSTLATLASCCSTSKMICASLDARKKEVYAAFFRRDDRGVVRLAGSISVMSPERLAEHIQEPVYMVGDAAGVYGALWQTLLGEKLEIAPAQLHVPLASALGLLAAEKYVAGEFLDVGSASPLYVRASDAELSLIKKTERL